MFLLDTKTLEAIYMKGRNEWQCEFFVTNSFWKLRKTINRSLNRYLDTKINNNFLFPNGD